MEDAVDHRGLLRLLGHHRTGTFLDDGLSKDTIGYLTFGLAFLLVFRVGQSYNRYNDARVKWGMMVNRTRDLSRQFFCYCPDAAISVRANKWIIAYVYACKQSLRWKDHCNELSHTLDAEELKALNRAQHMPIYCMEQISTCIRECLKQGHIDTILASMMDQNLTGFEDCTRLRQHPLPPPALPSAMPARPRARLACLVSRSPALDCTALP
jgi:putative membrane protein